jgi:hypothetical protein
LYFYSGYAGAYKTDSRHCRDENRLWRREKAVYIKDGGELPDVGSSGKIEAVERQIIFLITKFSQKGASA